VGANPGRHPAAWQAAQEILRNLDHAARFTAVTEDEDEPITHTVLVPALARRTEGDITGLYAEVMILEEGGLINNESYRLSKLPRETTWIIDTHYGSTGACRSHQPFGSTRLGRRRTLPQPFITELDHLAQRLGDGRR
jgi:hypothetical protein